MKQIILIGNMVNDVEVKEVKTGESPFGTFRFAVNSGTTENKTVDYFNIIVNQWHLTNLKEYLKKGKQLFIQGTPKFEIVTLKDNKTILSISLRADQIQLLGSKD